MNAQVVRVRLQQREEVIERGQRTFIEVGEALAAIREEGLYKAAGFTSFEKYCQERWGWGKSYASKLIAGAEVAKEFPIGNQGQAYALSRVPEDERAEVMQRVQENGGQVTAALITEVAGGEAPAMKCAHCEVHCPSGVYRRRLNEG